MSNECLDVSQSFHVGKCYNHKSVKNPPLSLKTTAAAADDAEAGEEVEGEEEEEEKEEEEKEEEKEEEEEEVAVVVAAWVSTAWVSVRACFRRGLGLIADFRISWWISFKYEHLPMRIDVVVCPLWIPKTFPTKLWMSDVTLSDAPVYFNLALPGKR